MTEKSMHWKSARLWAGAALSAVLTVLAYAPHHLWVLGFVSFVPLILSLRHSGILERAWFGWVASTAMTLGGFFWIPGLIVRFGGLPVTVGVGAYILLAMQQGMVGALGFSISRWIERGLGWSMVWSFPIAYVAAEAAIPLIFPWKFGYSQYLNPPFIQSAELGGPYLVTFVLVLANSLVAAIIARWLDREPSMDSSVPRPSKRSLWIAAGLVVGNFVYGFIRLPQIDARERQAPTTTLGLVEADIPIEEKWDTDLYQRNLYLHQKASKKLEEQGAELIVWPESAFELMRYKLHSHRFDDKSEASEQAVFARKVPFDVEWLPASDKPLPKSEEALLSGQVRQYAAFVPQRGFDLPLITGVTLRKRLTDEEQQEIPPARGGSPRRFLYYNSALLLDKEGRVEGKAHKIVRMPISEYVPFGKTLYEATGINLYDIIPTAGLFGAGEGPQIIEFHGSSGEEEFTIAILNCYEDLMPGFVRSIVKNAEEPPEVLLNLTNDAWFGRTAEPVQHFALSTFRAIETRTWLVRTTNTGISAFVDSAGRVVERTSNYKAETLMAEVPHLPAQKTLYVRFGSWPAILSWILLGIGFVFRRRNDDGPLEESKPAETSVE